MLNLYSGKKRFKSVKYKIKILTMRGKFIIFMLLGLEVIETKHTPDGPLIAWRIFLYFVERAISVFETTNVANKPSCFRTVSFEDHFIIFY